jgi:hypothetical protein
MKPTYRRIGLAVATLMLAACFVASSSASQGDYYRAYTNEKVVAHISLPGRAPQQMFLQKSGKKEYLYLQQSSQQGFTIVDVSKPAKPKVLDHVDGEKLDLLAAGLAVVESPKGTNANASGTSGTPAEDSGKSKAESVRILDISDPAHPRTVQSFNGVTSILPDDSRGLIFLANNRGVWILSHKQILRRHYCGSSDAIENMPDCN